MFFQQARLLCNKIVSSRERIGNLWLEKPLRRVVFARPPWYNKMIYSVKVR